MKIEFHQNVMEIGLLLKLRKKIRGSYWAFFRKSAQISWTRNITNHICTRVDVILTQLPHTIHGFNIALIKFIHKAPRKKKFDVIGVSEV